MGTLYVRDVPDERIATLKQYAAEEGKSLNTYAQEMIAERCVNRYPARQALFERLRTLPPRTGLIPAAQLIREDRDSR